MKRLLTGLATLLLIICLPLFVTAAENECQKKFAVAPEIVRIGKIGPAQIKEAQLTLQNNGKVELTIKSMTSDCPCTNFRFFDLDEKTPIALPLTIPAGENLEVKLIFDSSKTKYRGTFTKVILINTDDLEEPLRRVKLVGEIQE